MERLLHTITVLAWIVLAAALFLLFGLIVGSGAGRVVVSLGWLPDTRRLWATDGVWVLSGVLLLGLSRLYRRLAAEDNAGSIGAWLAGWALLLYGISSLLALVSGVAAVAFLIAILAVWEFRTLVVVTEAAARLGGPGPDATDGELEIDDPACDATVECGIAQEERAAGEFESGAEADPNADDPGRLDAHIGVTRGGGPSRASADAERRTKVGGPRR